MRLVAATQALSELPGGLALLDLETRFRFQVYKIVLKDIEDKSERRYASLCWADEIFRRCTSIHVVGH